VTSIGKRAFGYIFDGENEEYVVIDGVTIYGYKNTETQRYANDNGIKFVLLGNEPESEIGDVDGDGEITVIDATCVQSHMAQLIIIADDSIVFADANKDGVISIMDATMIQRHIAQLTTIPEDRLVCADTDKDGKINITDVTMIQRFIAQIIPSL